MNSTLADVAGSDADGERDPRVPVLRRSFFDVDVDADEDLIDSLRVGRPGNTLRLALVIDTGARPRIRVIPDDGDAFTADLAGTDLSADEYGEFDAMLPTTARVNFQINAAATVRVLTVTELVQR